MDGQKNIETALTDIRAALPVEAWDLGAPVPAGRWNGITRTYGASDVLQQRSAKPAAVRQREW